MLVAYSFGTIGREQDKEESADQWRTIKPTGVNL
jgi:hypothetical protein